MEIDPRRFVLSDVTLYRLIAWAYGTDCGYASKYGLVTGGPDWIHSDQFEIQALIPEGSPRNTRQQVLNRDAPVLQAMVRTLLSDRFKLVMHRETRELPVYALTVAKDGSKLLRSEEGSCINLEEGVAPAGPEKVCGSYLGGNKPPNKVFNMYGGTLDGLSRSLGMVLDRPILDRTGLTGLFDLHFEYFPEGNAVRGPRDSGQLPPDNAGPSIFTALQEQAGLKLEAAKGPVNVLVIDRVEKPAEGKQKR